METINNIELRDESIYPDENVLQSVLGKSYELYDMLLELLGDQPFYRQFAKLLQPTALF